MMWYQLRAFICWMGRKLIQMPKRLLIAAGDGLNELSRMIRDDGSIGMLLAFLISTLVGILGLVAGGVYEEIAKPKNTIVHLSQVIGYFGYTFLAALSLLIINTSWYCFKQEQHELLEKLKEHYDRTK